MAFHCGFLDSNRGHEGHEKVHAAEAAQEQIVTEAPVDESASTAPKPAPTVPMRKKTAQVVPTRGNAAGKGTASSSKKQAKGKGKESDKAEESDDDDADEETDKRESGASTGDPAEAETGARLSL